MEVIDIAWEALHKSRKSLAVAENYVRDSWTAAFWRSFSRDAVPDARSLPELLLRAAIARTIVTQKLRHRTRRCIEAFSRVSRSTYGRPHIHALGRNRYRNFCQARGTRDAGTLFHGVSQRKGVVTAPSCYRLPLARLWVMQSIWQFSAELPPPLLHAATWSASISSNL